jgi:hypothetical protein
VATKLPATETTAARWQPSSIESSQYGCTAGKSVRRRSLQSLLFTLVAATGGFLHRFFGIQLAAEIVGKTREISAKRECESLATYYYEAAREWFERFARSNLRQKSLTLTGAADRCITRDDHVDKRL